MSVTTVPRSVGATTNRLGGLEGLRGLTALYVVLFHCWLLSYPGFPRDSGPGEFGWMMYGRLAVVLFLVISGFSLGLAPAAHGWRLASVARFARRRAWRILPPYWAALVLSLAVAFLVVPASRAGAPTTDTVLVYALMLQDIVVAPTPNGAFWSIAVELELYAIFPILVVLRRRLGPVALLALAFVPAVVLGLMAPGGTPVEGSNRLLPNLAPVFVAGMIAAGEVHRRAPWLLLGLLSGAPVIGLIVLRGPVWTVHHYYWIDLAVAPSMAMLLIAVVSAGRKPAAGSHGGRPALGSAVGRLLDSAPLRGLGAMSYSLYLIHLPILMVLARGMDLAEHAAAATFLIGVPASLLAAWLFAKVFEAPFQRHRSWRELRAALRSRRAPEHATEPAAGRTGGQPPALRAPAADGAGLRRAA